MQLLTAAQMRAIENTAMGAGVVTGLELMERAGRGVVEAVHEWRPELAASPGDAAVLCGPGNNGGDGFVVARLLKGAGWNVRVLFLGDVEKLPPDAAVSFQRWREMGDVSPWGPLPDVDLYIDALFGGGLSRPLPDSLRQYLMNDISQRTMAVDGPSGLCLDSGRSLGFALPAGATCTFQTERRGHRIGDGPDLCGALFVKDIGLGDYLEPGALTDLLMEQPAQLAQPATLTLSKAHAGHKYSHGHALVLAGGVGKGGAARLAARGALRIGTGLVTVGAPPAALIENAAQLNAIMLMRIDGVEGVTAALEDARINAIVLGPGLGVSALTRDMCQAAIGASRSVVLDADALTSFKDDQKTLFDTIASTKASVVLTPHTGEFKRLFPDLAERLSEPAERGPAYSKIDAVKAAAAHAGCTVLMKGADTVIASPSGDVSIASAAYDRACPWLATAGSGDVLAGFIGGLLARGFSGFSAAETGASLHQECARHFGPGLIAEDLPETLPKVLRSLRV